RPEELNFFHPSKIVLNGCPRRNEKIFYFARSLSRGPDKAEEKVFRKLGKFILGLAFFNDSRCYRS
ncbi:MAG: hypothetical protein OEZ52_15520, partial [Candidatus Aminicenantes bacterium]|nr:hypothetical protein [Candidatus Aminicenantes bacterium]